MIMSRKTPVMSFAFAVIAVILLSGITMASTVKPHDVFIPGAGKIGLATISITADITGNYTVTLVERDKFTIVGKSSDTHFIYAGDTEIFEFSIKANNNTSDGKYVFHYKAYFNSTLIDEGTFTVAVGKGAVEGSCSSVFIIGGLITGAYLLAKKKRKINIS